jgi:hypothetical protein
LSRGGDSGGGPGADPGTAGRDPASNAGPIQHVEHGENADRVEHVEHVEHVEVRRARPPAPATVFGDTPIAGPALPEPADESGEPAEAEDLGAWVHHAAMVAALRAGAQACVAGIFMGIVLGFFLSGLMSGLALLLGLILCVGSVPVSVLAGFATYRQTRETERLRKGLCPRCGYDLRGLNTARCPECGTPLRPRRGWEVPTDSPGQDEPD